jgi:heme/copper-type cytochrome/quinol oxidase subunit 2
MIVMADSVVLFVSLLSVFCVLRYKLRKYHHYEFRRNKKQMQNFALIFLITLLDYIFESAVQANDFFRLIEEDFCQIQNKFFGMQKYFAFFD